MKCNRYPLLPYPLLLENLYAALSFLISDRSESFAGMEAPWMLARPDLRFDFRHNFLEVASSPVKLAHSSQKIRSSSPKTANEHSIKQLSSFSPSLNKRVSAAAIAKAAEVHKEKQRSKAIEKIHQLRGISSAVRGSRDDEKLRRKSMHQLLSTIRKKCYDRLQQLNNPMRGNIMRAIDEQFILFLLNKYDGYTLSVDAILRLVGAFDGLSVPHTIRSDEILQNCGLMENDSVETPTAATIKPSSPIQLHKGIGFRAKSYPETKGRIRNVGSKSLEPFPDTVVTEPSRRKEVYNFEKSLLLERGGSHGMNFAGSDFRDSPFMVPMKPYGKTVKNTEVQVDDSSMGFPTPLEKFQTERELYMDSIDSRVSSIIVMQEKFSNRTNRVELSLHRKKDLRGLWRPKTLSKQSLRPFISTT